MKKYIKPATAIYELQTSSSMLTTVSSIGISGTIDGKDDGFTLGAPEDFDWCDDDDYGW